MLLNPLDYNIKELNKLKPKKGRLLLSEPFMKDPYFKRSVVMLTEHNKKDGAIGIILNQSIDIPLNDALANFPKFDASLFMGGPVQTDRLFFMHNQGDIIENSEHIVDNFYWSGNFDYLKYLIKNQLIFPHEVKFFVGYSSWEYQQLEDEIEQESWLIINNRYKKIDEINDEYLWYSSLQKLGGKYTLLSNFPENPSLN